MPALPTLSSLSNTVMQCPLWVTFCTTILNIYLVSVYNFHLSVIKDPLFRLNDLFLFTNENAEKSSKDFLRSRGTALLHVS